MRGEEPLFFSPACWGSLPIFHVVSNPIDAEIWLSKLYQKETKEQSESSDRLFSHSPQVASVSHDSGALWSGGEELSVVPGNEPWWSSQAGLVSKSTGVLESHSPKRPLL